MSDDLKSYWMPSWNTYWMPSWNTYLMPSWNTYLMPSWMSSWNTYLMPSWMSRLDAGFCVGYYVGYTRVGLDVELGALLEFENGEKRLLGCMVSFCGSMGIEK